MNNIEKNMLEVLLSLKQDYGIVGVKSDFEAEGSRLDETFRLKELLEKAGIDLFVKIGGCEAVGDLYSCKELKAKGIIAPMIETDFAAKKFLQAVKSVYEGNFKNVDLLINTETKTSIYNIDNILRESNKIIRGIVIGRVDLSSSMGLSRGDINSSVILDSCIYLSKKAKEFGLKSAFGGGITFNTIPFIIKLKGVISSFESRKVIFRYDDNERRLKEVIAKAINFELLYLKDKEYRNVLTSIDKGRLNVMYSRLKDIKGSF